MITIRDKYAAPALLAILLTAPACMELDPTDDSQAEVGAAQAPLTGGDLVTSNGAPFSSVVKIQMHGFGCTATRIGPRRLLTAGHCVTATGLVIGDAIGVTNSLAGTFEAGTSFSVDDLHVHPTWSNDVAAATQRGNERAFDVALIDLTADLPAGIPSLPVRDEYVDGGLRGITVGYGCDDSDATHKGKKQRADFTAMTLAAFQALSASDDTLDYGKYTYNVIFNGGLATRTCHGDSGGPQLYRNSDGVWEVGALTSNHNDLVSKQARVGGLSRWIASPVQDSFRDGSWGMFLDGKSNLCIGVDGASTGNDASLMQFFCDTRKHTEDDQYWQLDALGDGFFHIVNGKSGRCIGVDGASIAPGARVAQYGCMASRATDSNQAWKFTANGDGKFRIVNGKSGKCIGVHFGSVDHAAVLLQGNCSGSADQGWNFVR